MGICQINANTGSQKSLVAVCMTTNRWFLLKTATPENLLSVCLVFIQSMYAHNAPAARERGSKMFQVSDNL